MPIIEVNHKTLREVAAATTVYCDAQDREMRIADEDIKSMLSIGWLGLDAHEFENKWEGVDDNESIAVKFRDSIEMFGANLISCANAYQKAQEDTYNEANWL